MKTASIKLLGIMLLLLAIGIMIGWYLKPNKLIEKNVFTTITKRDTILDTVYLARKPIYITRKADIIYRDIDTIVQTKSFLAKLDTITARDDTLNLKYLFPENRFELMIRQSKDTLFNKTYTNTITETKIEKIERPLWLDILSHVGAFLGGFLFGNINNK
jgi:hypothetical protein